MPFSDPALARDAILDHFTTEWNAQASPPELRYDDRTQDLPSGDVSWARVSVLHNTGRQNTMGETGNRRFRKTGIVTVQIFTPFGDGLTESDILVKVAVDAFEGKSTGGGDTVDFTNVRSQEIGRDGYWYQTNVLAEFDYDAVK